MYEIKDSTIHGKGVFPSRHLQRGTKIGEVICYWWFIPYITDLGSMINHSYTPNGELSYENGSYWLITTTNLKKQEITINYDTTPWYIAGSRSWYT